MKYRFLLMLCISNNAAGCLLNDKITVEDYYNHASDIFVGYISRVNIAEKEATAIKFILNKPHSQQSESSIEKALQFQPHPLTYGSIIYTVQVVPFKPFKSTKLFTDSVSINIQVGCSYNDIPELGAFGLFYIYTKEENGAYSASFIKKKKDDAPQSINFPRDRYDKHVIEVKRLANFVEIE